LQLSCLNGLTGRSEVATVYEGKGRDIKLRYWSSPLFDFFSLCWGHTNQLGSGLTIMSRWFLCLHCMDVSGVCSDQRSAARRRVYFHHEEKKYSRYGTTKRVNQCPTSLIMKVATRTARSSQDRSHGLLCSAFLSDKNCPILLSKTQLKSCNLCDVGSAPL
jgi:hypothetical protein